MILSKKIRKGVGLVVAALLLGQASLTTVADAADPLPPDVSVVELAKPAVVQVRAGATATFRFSDRAWPVAVGGTASGFIVNPDGAVVTSSRIIELLQKDDTAIRNALAERFFNEVQKQVGHRLSETERLGVAENTTLIEEVKVYKQVVLSDGQAVDFDIRWTGSPPPEALTTSTPVYSSRPVPRIQRPVTGEGVENLGEGVSPVITEPVTVKEPEQTPEPIIPLSANKEFDPVQELAVLKINASNLPSLPLMAADKDDVGQRATVIGYAGNADATALLAPASLMSVAVSSGSVTATKSGKMNANYGPLIDVEATIGPAGAGGPVITDKGEIIGLAGRTARAIGVYPVINTQAVLAALGKSGLSNASEPSEATRVYASALDMFSNGHMSKTMSILEDLLKLCPHHGPAKALMTEARQRKEAGDDNIYWPDMALYGGITLALIAAGGGYMGLRYRKLGPAAFPPALRRLMSRLGAKKGTDRGAEGDGSAAESAATKEKPISFYIPKDPPDSSAPAPGVSPAPSMGDVLEFPFAAPSKPSAQAKENKERPGLMVAAASDSAVDALPAPSQPSVAGKVASLWRTPKADAKPVIEFISGPLTGRRMVVPREGLLVGRDPLTCQVVLDDPFISKQHIFVGPDPLDKTAIIVTDKGSTNGTFLDSPAGERLEGTRTLQNGDQVYLGQRNAFVLRFE
ncbi:FHA domain-containing protein [Heliobacterium undosum]|uniref:FHA domain-containing protein n=1 Tax=Heliomicrobium undosum TaxID=121734 RepID=A0A845KZ85_9FIRM|nr:trypsin-like peptidase domain-containing protein [Heliomicrobium undosum]MZP28446.1 FHA domain-containing protein [Heliomicrobium undosum]